MFNQREIIGEYEIQKDKIIGRGNHGIVYICTKFNTNSYQPQENLCAKLTDVADNQKIQKYQQREYQILQIIKWNQKNLNFNLVQVYDVQYLEKQKKLFVVMEKCDCSLQYILDQKKVFTEDEILDFMSQFAKGYQGLYENKIVHRDLKPENILLKKNFLGKYIYKIADFGVGKIYKQNDFTTTNVGTPVYSAPENHTHYQDDELKYIISQMRWKKCVIDMYSFGIILYQMIFQNFPYNPQIQNIIQFLSYIKNYPIRVPRIPNFRQQIFEIIDGLLMYYPQNRLNFEQFCFKLQILTAPPIINPYQPDGDFKVIKYYIQKQIDIHSQTMNSQIIPYLQNILNSTQWNPFICESIFGYYIYKPELVQKYDDQDLKFFVSLKCLRIKQHFFNRLNRDQMIQFLNTQ